MRLYAGAEQAIALGLEGPVVDRLGLLDLAERPGQNLLRARDGDLDLIERLRLDDRIEEIHDLLIHACLLKLGPAAMMSPRWPCQIEILQGLARESRQPLCIGLVTRPPRRADSRSSLSM